MKAIWALDRYVSQTLQRLLYHQHGMLRGWTRIRWLWLSGAFCDRIFLRASPRPWGRVGWGGIDPEATVYRLDDGIDN